MIKKVAIKSPTNKFNSEIVETNVSLSPAKLIGETRHNPPANKEWTNSTYAYNKNLLKSLPVKDSMTSNIIKGYFYLSNNKSLARSKRMRNLKRKSTAKRLFVSKPEIKQTNDKVTITVYTFNREKQFLVRKLFFYNRHRNLLDFWRKNNTLSLEKSKSLLHYGKGTKQSLVKKLRINIKKQSRLNIKLKYQRSLVNKNLRTKLKKLSYFKKLRFFLSSRLKIKRFKVKRKNMFKRRFIRDIPYSGIKFKNEMRFLSFKVLTRKKQFLIFRKIFYYNFLRYALSMFNVKLSVSKLIDFSLLRENIKGKKGKKFKSNLNSIDTKIVSPTLPSIENTEKSDGNVKIYFYLNKKKYTLNLDLKDKLRFLQKKDKLDRWDFLLSNVNYMVSQFLTNILIKSGVNNIEKKLYLLFNNFCKKYYLIFLALNLKKEILLASHYLKLMVNRLKFGKFLPALKLLISKIYNKKTELNIVNLKYSHLNTDIFTESIALKLRKKTGLLKVLRKALMLVRTPYKFFDRSEFEKHNINLIEDLSVYRSLKLNKLVPYKYINKNTNRFKNKSSPDLLQGILKNLYPFSLINGLENNSKKSVDIQQKSKITSSKLINVLNTIRYKWVTGARVEAAGRLTRRYTASRSVFKFRYKGSLKNIDYSRKLDFLKKTKPVIMLRNHVKANSQYSLANSKRRIGAFGIKGWISGY